MHGRRMIGASLAALAALAAPAHAGVADFNAAATYEASGRLSGAWVVLKKEYVSGSPLRLTRVTIGFLDANGNVVSRQVITTEGCDDIASGPGLCQLNLAWARAKRGVTP